MIIQGSNNPLVIQFDADVSSVPALVVTLWCDMPGMASAPLIRWNKSDMSIVTDTAVCPITEEQTKALPAAQMVIEAKGLDSNGNTVFWDEYKLDTKRRRDRIIQLTQTGG